MKAFYKVMEKFSKSIKPKYILLSAKDDFEFSVSSPMQESDWLCYEACGCAVTTDHNPISVRNPKVRGTLFPHAIIYLVVWIYSGIQTTSLLLQVEGPMTFHLQVCSYMASLSWRKLQHWTEQPLYQCHTGKLIVRHRRSWCEGEKMFTTLCNCATDPQAFWRS